MPRLRNMHHMMMGKGNQGPSNLTLEPEWYLKANLPDLLLAWLDYTEPFSESPREFHLFTAIFTISSLVGRNRYIVQGEDIIYPNQYCLIVAPSSLFKKTSATGIFKKFFSPPRFHELLPRSHWFTGGIGIRP